MGPAVGQNPTDEELLTMIDEVDTNKSGCLGTPVSWLISASVTKTCEVGLLATLRPPFRFQECCAPDLTHCGSLVSGGAIRGV